MWETAKYKKSSSVYNFNLKDQHGDGNVVMMPWREWELPKGDHDEEEVDEDGEDDGDCPKSVP